MRGTDSLIALTAPYFERRLREIRKAIDAPDYATASRNILELAARWTPDALARQIGQALEWSMLEGREAVFTEVEGGPRFADKPPHGIRFPEQSDFLRQKRPMETKEWQEAMYGTHDRAWVIAGATNTDMLGEFHTAMIAAAETNDITVFARQFDQIVEKYGWSYNGGRDWRIRTIFQTNMRTSYMAGRLKQMRDPAVVKLRPYWQYVHADTRVPMTPRAQHVAWDGMVLRWDDPWWEMHFPPNDWLCSCGVYTLSEADLRALGKTGPDTAPPIVMVPTSTGKGKPTIPYPEGIGYGWAYQPGGQWSRGLVPEQIEAEANDELMPAPQGAMPQIVGITKAEPVEELLRSARRFSSPALPVGKTPEYYISAFLDRFGASIGKDVLWQDRAGTNVLISDGLFRDRRGALKLKRGRERYLLQLADTIIDPDEIWLGVRARRTALSDPLQHFVTRRYLRAGLLPGAETSPWGGMGMFELGRQFWDGITAFDITKDDGVGSFDPDYFQSLRIGKRIYKRPSG